MAVSATKTRARYRSFRELTSIPANVAEGFNRHLLATYRLPIATALGSQAELETQLELANRLGYVPDDQHQALMASVASVGQLLHGLRRALANPPE